VEALGALGTHAALPALRALAGGPRRLRRVVRDAAEAILARAPDAGALSVAREDPARGAVGLADEGALSDAASSGVTKTGG